MPFPTQRETEVSLLRVLQDLGGAANPKEVYTPLAKRFPQLTSADLVEIQGTTGVNKWENHVQWVRQRLVEKGELDGSVRGVWRITEAGRVRAKRPDDSDSERASDTQVVPDLHPLLLEDLSRRHMELVSRGEVHSAEALASFYATFRQRFGPDVLRRNDGEALLSLMHETGREGLVYWLEFKDDTEFPAIFGGIAGGSALKYGLYRRRETGAWMTGTSMAQREISTADAVQIARRNRDQLLAACEVLARFPVGADDAAYLELQGNLAGVAPDVHDSSWGRKYFALLNPDKLDDFHAVAYQRFNLIKLLQVPAAAEGRYVNSGRFVALSRAFAWPMNHLTTALNRRNGQPHRYWRVGTRSSDDGQSYWQEMQDTSTIAVGWTKLGDLSALIGREDFKDTLKERISTINPTTPQAAGRSAQQLVHFCKTISERDCVVACDGARVLGIGRITGPYIHVEGAHFPHRRAVDWLDIGEWQLPTMEGLQTTVHECRRHPENLVAIERRVLESPGRPTQQPKEADSDRDAASRPIAHASSQSVPWAEGGTIGRIQDVLNRKGQVILYGPPGTGKTFWAERAASSLAALWNFGRPLEQLDAAEHARISRQDGDSLVRFCSFHPGYGYEDFIEGYRPSSNGSSIQFVREDGVFKKLCGAAAENPSRRYYLIVDEINRGDIPRIFGELLTLLDKPKRGASVLLPLSRQSFTVPHNVLVIGTMNTADRSIALLDTALRRRFGFIELLPDVSTLGDTVVSGVPLGPWLAAINRLITENVGRDGRNLQIGHSYFLAGERPIQEFSHLSRILQEDILPLLEEYCYDDWAALEKILGSGFVDASERRFKMELFEPERQAGLVQAILACTPDVSTSPIAVAADAEASASDSEDEDALEEVS